MVVVAIGNDDVTELSNELLINSSLNGQAIYDVTR